jgi:hypothetical protein
MPEKGRVQANPQRNRFRFCKIQSSVLLAAYFALRPSESAEIRGRLIEGQNARSKAQDLCNLILICLLKQPGKER